ncbi:hypothetical protein Tco_1453332, partial [Tanacetum coccineum]
VFGHVLDECPKKIVSDVSKNLKMPRQDARGPPISLKPKSNFVYCPIQPTNKTSSKQRKLDSLDNMNEWDFKLVEKGAISNVVSFVHETTSKGLGCPTITPLAKIINDIERQMVDEKLVLVVDDWKPLKKVDDMINTDSDSKVEEVLNETAGFMASISSKIDNSSKNCSGVGNKILYEQWIETYNDDSYDDDDFDGGGLTEDQLKNANDFYMSLHGQLR